MGDLGGQGEDGDVKMERDQVPSETPATTARDQRRAEALRANLRRRKQQKRVRELRGSGGSDGR